MHSMRGVPLVPCSHGGLPNPVPYSAVFKRLNCFYGTRTKSQVKHPSICLSGPLTHQPPSPPTPLKLFHLPQCHSKPLPSPSRCAHLSSPLSVPPLPLSHPHWLWGHPKPLLLHICSLVWKHFLSVIIEARAQLASTCLHVCLTHSELHLLPQSMSSQCSAPSGPACCVSCVCRFYNTTSGSLLRYQTNSKHGIAYMHA